VFSGMPRHRKPGPRPLGPLLRRYVWLTDRARPRTPPHRAARRAWPRGGTCWPAAGAAAATPAPPARTSAGPRTATCLRIWWSLRHHPQRV